MTNDPSRSLDFSSIDRAGELLGRSVRVLLETPITFDVGDHAVHSPMVQVKVGEVVTKLILDTGATEHVLTMKLTKRAGLESEPGEPGTDHAGVPVPSWELGEVPIEVEKRSVRLRKVVATDGPASFEGWGVGGFLSPQNLHASAFVVLDLLENELILAEGDTPNMTAWLRERYPLLQALSLRLERGESVLVRASIVPFGDVVTMLNTGTTSTEFARSVIPDLRGAQPENLGLGISGAEVLGEEVRDQTLQVGEAEFALPVLFVREKVPPEHPDAQVGMDILRGTVLALSRDVDEPVLWMVPAPKPLGVRGG